MFNVENSIDGIIFNTIYGKLILNKKQITISNQNYVIKLQEPFNDNFKFTSFELSLVNDVFTYKNNSINQLNNKSLFTYVKKDDLLLLNYGRSDSMKYNNIVKLDKDLHILNWTIRHITNEHLIITHNELSYINFYYKYNNESNYFAEFYEYGILVKKNFNSYNINITNDNNIQNIYLINRYDNASKTYSYNQDTFQIIERENKNKSITYFFIKKDNYLKFTNAVLIINNVKYQETHKNFTQKYKLEINNFQWQYINKYCDLRSIIVELNNFIENFKQQHNLICYNFMTIGPLNF